MAFCPAVSRQTALLKSDYTLVSLMFIIPAPKVNQSQLEANKT